MKKINFLAIAASTALLISCNSGGGISTNVKLNTAEDTLAYAYGVGLAERGVKQYLAQMGLVRDTAQMRQSEMLRINAEQDSVKRTELIKELTQRLDSIGKTNKKNMADFLSGLKEGINTDDKKAAYMRGIELGGQIKQMSEGLSKQVYGQDSDEKINTNLMLSGIVASLKKQDILVENPEGIVETKMQQIQEERTREEFGENIEAEEKFLAENKTKEGVVTLPSGLQYKVITEGKGEKPASTDKVKVHYQGTLLDGTVFDSSIQRGEPATFNVNRVVSGWTEALQLMPVGSKWILYVPAELAYGSRGANNIPPYSMLTFEVELISIEK